MLVWVRHELSLFCSLKGAENIGTFVIFLVGGSCPINNLK
jgi:hypothetical protein